MRPRLFPPGAAPSPTSVCPSRTESGMSFGMQRVLRALASLKLTLAILGGLAAGIIVSYNSEVRTTWALVLPLVLFAVNLSAAVATNAVFRRQGALLVFHLSLIAIVLLVAAGRLTYLKGQLELAEGMTFSGELKEFEAGPLHRPRLDRIPFVNEGFRIEYARGVRRGHTYNQVAWRDDAGRWQRAVIGDQDPLVLKGYRFYTSFNKGFAPTFLWIPESGEGPVLGTIHLPSFPIHEYTQALEWQPPGSGLTLWTGLQFDEVILDPQQPSEFRLPREHLIVVRLGESRWEMRPGERLRLPGGMLEYRGLRSWMGYTVFYDWTLPWLFAACALAVASLAWHFWRKFAARPWDG
jgi:cytochrome c biogenesis protein ResB